MFSVNVLREKNAFQPKNGPVPNYPGCDWNPQQKGATMTRYCLLGVLVGALLLGLSSPSTAVAGNPWGRAPKHRRPPDYEGNPKRFVAAPPGPHRYSEYNTGCYPWYGYGFGVPTYSWGYFGATYRPAAVCHTGYYGTFTQWGYRNGY